MDAPALGMDGPYYTEATVGLFAGLDLDLWGVHRSAVAAAIGAHNAALAETAAVELSLTTGVAQLYYSMQASYQMLDLLEQTRDVIDYAVKAHQSKVAHDLEAQVPFHGARAQILAVDKQIAAVKGQITETRESLRALIGAGPAICRRSNRWHYHESRPAFRRHSLMSCSPDARICKPCAGMFRRH